MKLVIDQKRIKRNKMIGNITAIVGIVVLVAGLILNFNPTPIKTLISFGALILGFIISQVSSYFVTRFGRKPRYDEIITENLEKLSDDYTFYVYNSPVQMLLVGPYGLWIPTPITATGEIYYDKKWKQRGGGFLMKLFGQVNLGRPEVEIQSNEKDIRKFLSKHFEEDEFPPIKSILVSLHPKATIGDVDDAPLPIVESDALRRTIRRYDRKSEEEIPQEKLDKINQLLTNGIKISQDKPA
jgi:hypothetical protein